MQYKTTTRLFKGTYQYKVVLVCAGASVFRNGDIESAIQNLKRVVIDKKQALYIPNTVRIKTQEDLDYALKLAHTLMYMEDIEIRVESPWISIYTNTLKNVNALTKLDEDHIKYVSVPPKDTTLVENTVIMPKMNYDYRVTLGKTSHENSAFVEWAESNPKLKLTKGCKTELQRPKSWGGTHFYVLGDNNLLMAKMHLASSIAKIERIVKK